MPVLIEGLCVVALLDTVAARYPGGIVGFFSSAPNRNSCTDGELTRVGFMSPLDVQAYVQHLESHGFCYRRGEEAIDLTVVDQREGILVPCRWVEFGVAYWNENKDQPIAICRKTTGKETQIKAPKGWDYKQSLSARHVFVPTGGNTESLVFVRHDGGVDVYKDKVSGKEFFVGRTNSAGGKK